MKPQTFIKLVAIIYNVMGCVLILLGALSAFLFFASPQPGQDMGDLFMQGILPIGLGLVFLLYSKKRTITKIKERNGIL